MGMVILFYRRCCWVFVLAGIVQVAQAASAVYVGAGAWDELGGFCETTNDCNAIANAVVDSYRNSEGRFIHPDTGVAYSYVGTAYGSGNITDITDTYWYQGGSRSQLCIKVSGASHNCLQVTVVEDAEPPPATCEKYAGQQTLYYVGVPNTWEWPGTITLEPESGLLCDLSATKFEFTSQGMNVYYTYNGNPGTQLGDNPTPPGYVDPPKDVACADGTTACDYVDADGNTAPIPADSPDHPANGGNGDGQTDNDVFEDDGTGAIAGGGYATGGTGSYTQDSPSAGDVVNAQNIGQAVGQALEEDIQSLQESIDNLGGEGNFDGYYVSGPDSIEEYKTLGQGAITTTNSLGVVQGIRDIQDTFQQKTGSCPVISMDLSMTIINETIETDLHCTTYENVAGVLQPLMLLLYAIAGFRHVLSA